MSGIDLTLTVHLPQTVIDALADAVVDRIGVPTATKWLDVDGAADHLATTRDAVRKGAQRGQIPSHQPFGRGSRYLFDRAELDAWVRLNGTPS